MLNIPKHPDFLYPNGCHPSPSLLWSASPTAFIYQMLLYLLTYKMEGTTGLSLLSPGVWNAAPLGTTAGLGLLVGNEGQSALVISAGKAGRWACRPSVPALTLTSPPVSWECHLPAPQACHEHWLMSADIFKRGGSSPGRAAKRLSANGFINAMA